MFSTSLVAAAVAGLVASNSNVVLPTWQTDYRTALTQAAEQHKPVAVFIGQGGAEKLTAGVGADAAQRLRQNFVCLSVDTATAGGKDLAGQFQLNTGLVISDRTGARQALRHEGAVTPADLGGYLTRFSTVETAATTETHGGPVVQTSYYASPVQQTAYAAPVAAPIAPAPYAAPAMIYPSYPSMGGFGGCAGGNCGGYRMSFGGGCPGGRCGR